MKKGRPPDKMKRPRQSAVRQNAGPLALFSFVVNVTASFFRQFSRHISTWEKELNKRRQTLKPLENQGFFRLSLLYRNGTAVPACCWPTASPSNTFRSGWGTATLPPRRTSTPTWITSLKSPRHRRWRQGLRYRRAATSEAGGDRLMLGGTDDFLSEKVKEHGIARFGKRKEPVIGLITGS